MTDDTIKGLTTLLDESEVTRELHKDIEAGRAASTGLPRRGGVLSSVRGDGTPAAFLREQLTRIDNATTSLREAIHRKVHEIKAAHELRLVEIGIAYDRAVAVAADQRERDTALAERHTRETLAEVDRIVTRL